VHTPGLSFLLFHQLPLVQYCHCTFQRCHPPLCFPVRTNFPPNQMPVYSIHVLQMSWMHHCPTLHRLPLWHKLCTSSPTALLIDNTTLPGLISSSASSHINSLYATQALFNAMLNIWKTNCPIVSSALTNHVIFGLCPITLVDEVTHFTVLLHLHRTKHCLLSHLPCSSFPLHINLFSLSKT
jgi:hypothetical protein